MRGTRTASIVLSTLMLLVVACAPPLDPETAKTGGPLTDNQRATDVLRYELELEIFPPRRSISGTSTTVVRAVEPIESVELRLDPRFQVGSVRAGGDETVYSREAGLLTIELPQPLAAGEETQVSVEYSGRPHVAERAPWDGGFVWAEAPGGRPWIASAVQGEGCDLWWPCKDHFGDKPDRIDFQVTVPDELSVALNGVLQSVEATGDGRRTFHWRIGVPISDYNVSLNVGPFARIESSYTSINGTEVPIEFWALDDADHEEKARRLIEEDLRAQIAWYEKTLGPYPWGGEKLGFVETPHLGMEHQTLIAYGNEFKRDDHGFDWLLQHELAHEWFGNLMTHERANDAWLHEGYGAYMQAAYSLDRDGEAAYHHRMYKSYLDLENCDPVAPDGDATANDTFTRDIYRKGSWTLHTARWLTGDDPFWRATRRLLYGTATPWDLPYPIPPVYRSTEDFTRIISEEAGRDLTWLTDVYLRQADLPELITERSKDTLALRWQVPDNKPFPMPVPIRIDDKTMTVEIPHEGTTLEVPENSHVIIDPEMQVLRRLPIIGTCEEIRQEQESQQKS